MANPQVDPRLIRSERQRVLQQLTFAENQVLSRDLPRDTVLKHLMLRLSGSVVTTFASGTPVADAQSTFDNIIPRIEVIVDGSRVVKSVRPHLMHMQQLLSTLIQAERRASAAASAATDNFPTADGGFAYGTTGQISTVAETVLVSFENVYAKGDQAHSTWLNLKGRASAEVKLVCAAFSKLLGFGNTAPVVYTSSTFVVDITTLEAQDVPAEVQFSDWKQTTKEVSFSAETTEFAVDINRGNRLQALMLFARDGAAGTTTTATGKLASNLAITKLAFVRNGQEIVKSTNFKQLQAENRAQYGVDAKFASNVSRLDGVARLDFTARDDLSTALDLRPQVADSSQLNVTTNTASNVSYTNPVSLTIMTEEIVMPR
jgi:hypothetical protein